MANITVISVTGKTHQRMIKMVEKYNKKQSQSIPAKDIFN